MERMLVLQLPFTHTPAHRPSLSTMGSPRHHAYHPLSHTGRRPLTSRFVGRSLLPLLLAAAMTRALTTVIIKEARGKGSVKRLNTVVKFLNGTMLIGIRLRSGYVIDNPPAPPAIDSPVDFDRVEEKYIEDAGRAAVVDGVSNAATSTAALTAGQSTVTKASTRRAPGSADGGLGGHSGAGLIVAYEFKFRTKQTAVKSTGGCCWCSFHACHVRQSHL